MTLYLEDIEYAEISQITGLSESNARTRMHRIKNQIKKAWEDKSGLKALGYLMIGEGLITGAAYLYIRYKTFSPGTYSLPITEFLLRAKKKISYFNLIDYFIIIPLLLLLGTGGGLVFVVSLLKYTDNSVLLIIIWIIFFFALSVFGFLAGRKNWEKEYGPLFQRIVEMKNNYSLKLDQIK